MIVVSIPYNIETKGATSSDIFPVENGPIKVLVGDRKNSRAGLCTGCSRFLFAAITNINRVERTHKNFGALNVI
jgi:hypothetical protein